MQNAFLLDSNVLKHLCELQDLLERCFPKDSVNISTTGSKDHNEAIIYSCSDCQGSCKGDCAGSTMDCPCTGDCQGACTSSLMF